MALNGKYINKSLILIITEIDENGLDQDSRLKMLKDNITSIIDKSRVDIKHRIFKIKYDNDKLDKMSEEYEKLYADFLSEIRNSVLKELSYDDLKDDGMYFALKSKIKNKLYRLNQDLDDIVREGK